MPRASFKARLRLFADLPYECVRDASEGFETGCLNNGPNLGANRNRLTDISRIGRADQETWAVLTDFAEFNGIAACGTQRVPLPSAHPL